MNVKAILLSLILACGLLPGTANSMQSSWFSTAKLSALAQKVAQSDTLSWLDQYKAPLLIGATALIAAGAYKYFWKKTKQIAEPTNEQIKAQIKSETFAQLIEYDKKVQQKRDELLNEKQERKEALKRQQRMIDAILTTNKNSLEVNEELDGKAKIIADEIKQIEKKDIAPIYYRTLIEPFTTTRISQPLLQTDYRLILKPLIHRTSNDLLGVEAEYYYYCDKSREIVELPFEIPQEPADSSMINDQKMVEPKETAIPELD